MNELEGIALKNYRGIGPEFVSVKNMSRFNYFLGENNSGKSTFLNFLSRYFEEISKTRAGQKIDNLERNISGGPIEVLIPNASDDLISKILGQNEHLRDHLHVQVRNLVDYISVDNFVWLHFKEPFKQPEGFWTANSSDNLENIFRTQSEWQNLWSALTRQRGAALLSIGYQAR